MGDAEFRANAAGYLDSATMLTRTVVEALKSGEEMTAKKLVIPAQVYDHLREAEKHIQLIASWLLDPRVNLTEVKP